MFIISDNKRRKTSFGCAFNSSSRVCLVNNSSTLCESFLSPDAEGGASTAAASSGVISQNVWDYEERFVREPFSINPHLLHQYTSGDLGTTEAEASTGWRGNPPSASAGLGPIASGATGTSSSSTCPPSSIPFHGDFSGCSNNAQALFAAKPDKQENKMKKGMSLFNNHDFVTVEGTHNKEGRSDVFKLPERFKPFATAPPARPG